MKIAAFNVKRLGWKKVNNADVRNNLIKIVSRYSVVVLLEVMDKSGKAMNMFLTELNKNHPYLMECSESLGRRTHREKFVYFYRGDEVKMIKSYQYEERTDVLAREPYILQFECPNTVVQNLVLIPVHTKPRGCRGSKRWRNYVVFVLMNVILSLFVVFALHQLLREISVSLAAKCSTLFTSYFF
uniref:Uncharacterized protein n=1 Tax=Sander lucioperca TaxID=283035 RepID=A0A8C9YF09_SANLU